MQLSDDAIEEFRALYEQEFGEIMAKDEAAIRAQQIVALYEKLYEMELKQRRQAPAGQETTPETFA